MLSILERLELQSARILDRLGAVEVRVETTNIETNGLKEQVRIANGRTSLIETETAMIKARHVTIDNIEKGRREQRADDLSKLDTIKEYWPLIGGVITGCLGLALLIWSGF